MAYDEHLASRLRHVVGDAPEISERKMFGGLCLMERGHMLVGIVGSDLMVRVGPASTRRASRKNTRDPWISREGP
ncbi:MAG: TfoX/Sxy family protein [Rhodothermales bacterium]|nr:TfoX/Sxy family protein [Rhodothermales bacterium]MBO6779332.1 TfoX/Sxy family protein [Rhodothermales bacterium]